MFAHSSCPMSLSCSIDRSQGLIPITIDFPYAGPIARQRHHPGADGTHNNGSLVVDLTEEDGDEGDEAPPYPPRRGTHIRTPAGGPAPSEESEARRQKRKLTGSKSTRQHASASAGVPATSGYRGTAINPSRNSQQDASTGDRVGGDAGPTRPRTAFASSANAVLDPKEWTKGPVRPRTTLVSSANDVFDPKEWTKGPARASNYTHRKASGSVDKRRGQWRGSSFFSSRCFVRGPMN